MRRIPLFLLAMGLAILICHAASADESYLPGPTASEWVQRASSVSWLSQAQIYGTVSIAYSAIDIHHDLQRQNELLEQQNKILLVATCSGPDASRIDACQKILGVQYIAYRMVSTNAGTNSS